MNYFESFLRRFSVISFSFIVFGCVTTAEHEKEVAVAPEELAKVMKGRPDSLRGYHEVLLAQGERNVVLNQARIGVLAFSLGNLDIAKEALEEAALGIEAVYADNEAAENARSNFTKESIKDFKGEPYERAMVYYYLGLVYLAQGDFENARASFKAGEFQDTLSTAEVYQSDFAVLNYLSGWSSFCHGDSDLAEEAFSDAVGHRASLNSPGSNDNVLVIYESGDAPVKYADGQHREQLKVRRGSNDGVSSATYVGNREETILGLGTDVFFQASTRGGREVDAVLAGKAQFKDGLDAAGNVLTTVGTATATAGLLGDNDDAAVAGLAILLVGVIAQAAAEASQPDADIRYIDLLPSKVSVGSLSTDEFSDGELKDHEAEVTKVFPGDKCSLVWMRDSDLLSTTPHRAPNSSVIATTS